MFLFSGTQAYQSKLDVRQKVLEQPVCAFLPKTLLVVPRLKGTMTLYNRFVVGALLLLTTIKAACPAILNSE